MTPAWSIDEIVQEVVRRLAAMSDGAGKPSAGSAPPHAADPNQPGTRTEPSEPGTVRLASQLITLETLKGPFQQNTNHAIKRLEVPAGAVLTPSVRDELRERRISVRYVDPRTPGDRAVLVASLLAREPAAVWARRIEAIGATQVVADTEPETLLPQLQAAWQGHDSRAVVFSETPIATTLQLNRHAAFRAAWCREVPEVERAMREIQLNLLIIDPTARGGWEIQRLLECFLRDCSS